MPKMLSENRKMGRLQSYELLKMRVCILLALSKVTIINGITFVGAQKWVPWRRKSDVQAVLLY